jgi:hypothetical protein
MLMAPDPDPFLQHMFARMSPGAKFLFTPDQIAEIRKAFSARRCGNHALDCRHSIRLFGKSYYLILLAGRERRSVPPCNVTKLSQRLALCLVTIACAACFLIF